MPFFKMIERGRKYPPGYVRECDMIGLAHYEYHPDHLAEAGFTFPVDEVVSDLEGRCFMIDRWIEGWRPEDWGGPVCRWHGPVIL